MGRTKIDHADLDFNHRELFVPGLGFVGALLVCRGISFLYCCREGENHRQSRHYDHVSHYIGDWAYRHHWRVGKPAFRGFRAIEGLFSMFKDWHVACLARAVKILRHGNWCFVSFLLMSIIESSPTTIKLKYKADYMYATVHLLQKIWVPTYKNYSRLAATCPNFCPNVCLWSDTYTKYESYPDTIWPLVISQSLLWNVPSCRSWSFIFGVPGVTTTLEK